MEELKNSETGNLGCCCGASEKKEKGAFQCCDTDMQHDSAEDDFDVCCDIFSYERPSEETARKTKRRTCC